MNRHFHLLVVFVLGCVIGSFLNVVRYRLPRRKDFVSGRSMCPGCGAKIAWYDNIPILSYVVLGGRCRSCGAGISWEYLAMEAATGVSFALIWLRFPPQQALGYFVFASILIACAGIDFDLRIIPDKLTLPGTLLGLVFSVSLLRAGPALDSLLRSAFGAAVGAGTLLAVSLLYRVVRRAEGMGGGDIKLMGMVGAFLGFELALLTIFMASVGGAVVGLFLSRRSPLGMKAALPFGVFLSPAAIICLLWGNAIIKAYLSLM